MLVYASLNFNLNINKHFLKFEKYNNTSVETNKETEWKKILCQYGYAYWQDFL